MLELPDPEVTPTSAHDTGLGIFKEILTYKAVDAGSHVTFVDPKYTSTS